MKYILPGTVASETGIDVKSVYKILLNLEKIGTIKGALIIICPKCAKQLAYASVLGEVPDRVSCADCKWFGNGLENAYVVFKQRQGDFE